MTQADLNALERAARLAWTFTLPLIEVASARTAAFAGGGPWNTFAHGRDLVDHTAREITTPNNDTLYSSAHVDLSRGPVTVTIPPTGGRYFSLALMDAYTNNFAILGTRTTGGDGGRYVLVGPDEPRAGRDVVRAPTRRVWALARILVEGEHDLDAARAVQDGLRMQGPAVDAPPPAASRDAPWQDYFRSAARLMAENPPLLQDGVIVQAMAPLGLDAFDPDRFTADEQAAIARGVAQARQGSLRSGLKKAPFTEGWTYPYARLGDFGQEYDYRAAVAIGGLAALPPEEAMYMRAKGDLPRYLFDPGALWRLHFPADRLLPVNSFWSLTLYEGTDDGQFFFADNPLRRYAIGDRSPGLRYNPDGSLDIWIGRDNPGEDRVANWLPASDRPFSLFLRAYLPRPDLLHGAYLVPPVERVQS
ncbi:MAG: DUF1254 domain-containing protein [Phenylobacterium sp.]|uniref:DUF1254 domain-containing protein n=1 Tax=Phenylobacterium sp. TaxID=1871053 RepID=UPI001A608E2D|nr:DUF1254 domain-containing protein [Phenylobacterium sp.]MBL8771238.1 DUF1254 domain-containing protein [Phenylobacterium sp.]